jgi:hypothetical protein
MILMHVDEFETLYWNRGHKDERYTTDATPLMRVCLRSLGTPREDLAVLGYVIISVQ